MTIATSTFAEQYALYGLATARGSVPGARPVGALAGAAAELTVILLLFLILLFPDGRLPSRRWRPVAWALFVVAAALGHAEACKLAPKSAAVSPTPCSRRTSPTRTRSGSSRVTGGTATC